MEYGLSPELAPSNRNERVAGKVLRALELNFHFSSSSEEKEKSGDIGRTGTKRNSRVRFVRDGGGDGKKSNNDVEIVLVYLRASKMRSRRRKGGTRFSSLRIVASVAKSGSWPAPNGTCTLVPTEEARVRQNITYHAGECLICEKNELHDRNIFLLAYIQRSYLGQFW